MSRTPFVIITPQRISQVERGDRHFGPDFLSRFLTACTGNLSQEP